MLQKSAFSQFLDGFDTVLFDCDGVLWNGSEVISGSVKVVSSLQQLGKNVFYVTNNSTRSRDEYAKKCQHLGFPAIKEQIIGTAFLTASYLQEIGFCKKVYLVGSRGLTDELDQVNINHFGCGLDPVPEDNNILDVTLDDLHLDPDVGAVVVGFDPHISYMKILKAASYLRRPDVLFITTNKDEGLPSGHNFIKPGTGSIVASVETAAMRAPIVLGKPEPYGFNKIQKQHNLNSTRTLMIGDNIKTDILLGHNCGLQTLLVLTGVATKDDVTHWTSQSTDSIRLPDFYIPSIGDLLPWFEFLSK